MAANTVLSLKHCYIITSVNITVLYGKLTHYLTTDLQISMNVHHYCVLKYAQIPRKVISAHVILHIYRTVMKDLAPVSNTLR